MIKFLSALFLLSPVFADSYSKVAQYSNSLEKYLMLDMSHVKEIIPKISVKKPTAFQRWQMEKTGAEATYNDITNTIILKDEYFVGDNSNYRVIGLNDLKDNEKYRYFLFASTTLHELSHADFDVTIESSNKEIRHLLENKIKPWFASKFPGYNSKIATHELFGYTAGDGVFQIYQKISDVMINHGIKYPSMECFPQKALERIALRLDLAKSLEFKMISENADFYKSIIPDFVFVKGKELDLRNAKFPDEFKQNLYDYFVTTYQFPLDGQALIDKLNNHELFYTTLEKCYEKILNNE